LLLNFASSSSNKLHFETNAARHFLASHATLSLQYGGRDDSTSNVDRTRAAVESMKLVTSKVMRSTHQPAHPGARQAWRRSFAAHMGSDTTTQVSVHEARFMLLLHHGFVMMASSVRFSSWRWSVSVLLFAIIILTRTSRERERERGVEIAHAVVVFGDPKSQSSECSK